MAFNFYVNSNIVFGRGAIARLSDLITDRNIKHIMIVYDNGVKMAGIVDTIMNQVNLPDVNYVVFDKVIPNPTNEIVETAADIARDNHVDGIVAIGGGSSIDLAKAVNILMTNPGSIGDYGGINQVVNKGLPLIAVPTTAGTSSEITNVCVLIDTKKVIKYVIIDNKIMPSDVIEDPDLTATMPPLVTAATGMDAITHAVESYLSNMATPLTKYNALKGLSILYENIRKVVKNGSDMEAREQMMLGCIITGFSFSNANLGLVHGIAHTLSAHFGLAHGMANAAVLPYVVRYNAPSCPQKMADLAEAIGLPLSGNPEEDQYKLADALEVLIKDLRISTLSEQKIERKDLTMLADDVLKEPVLDFNPKQNITRNDIIGILEMAY